MNAKLSHILLIIVLLAASLAMVMPEPVRAAPLAGCYDANNLCYGLYWFGLNNANQQFVHGEANPYFDPAKPTLIFVHGWQPGISALNPPNFTYSYIEGMIPKSVNTANAWINAGWNVGIFYWNQFSDEADRTDAEAKIWVNDGPQRMRWKKGGGSYEEAPAGTPGAGELLYEAYLAAMTEYAYTGGNIRLAGHSLGNQMVTRLARLIDDGIEAGTVPEKLRPTRVTLLDPYWSIGAKDYLGGKTTAQMSREYIAGLLPTGTLFEWYHSSSLTVEPWGDSNEGLKPMILWADMHPDYEWDDMSKHCAAYNLYFWSYAFAGPAACSGEACLGMNRLLARLSDAQLAAVSRSDYTWAQSAGNLTPTPNDDAYTSASRAGAPYSINTPLSASPPTQGAGGRVTIQATVKDSSNAPVPDGALVTFTTSLGTISPRAVTSGGVATATLTSATIGTANVSATTHGLGGTIQASTSVNFVNFQQPHYDHYLPLVMKP